MFSRTLVSALVFVFASGVLIESALAENEGERLLDQAIEAKLTAANLNELSEVISLLDKALEAGLDEENTDLAESLLAAVLLQRAAAVSAAVFQATPGDPRVAAQLPQLVRAALGDLERAIEIDPEKMESQFLLGRLLSIAGQRERGRDALSAALELAVEDIDRAKIFAARGDVQDDPDAQLEDYQAALELMPELPGALRRRGQALLNRGDAEAALADFDKALEIEPGDAETLEARAVALAKLGRFDEAIESLDAAIEVEPRLLSAYVRRAQVNIELGDMEQAVNDLDKALLLAPNHLASLVLRANCLQALEKPDRALADIERALQVQPNFAPALQMQVALLLQAERLQEALDVMLSWHNAEPGNAEVLVQLAITLRQMGRIEDAIESFSAALERNDQLVVALQGRADSYLTVGRQTEAIADYEAALEINPEDPTVLNNLAWVFSTSKNDSLRDGERALELAIAAAELTEYKEAFILSTLAAAHAENGDFEAARKWIAEAQDKSSDELREAIDKEAASYEEEEPFREELTTEDQSQGLSLLPADAGTADDESSPDADDEDDDAEPAGDLRDVRSGPVARGSA